MESQTCIRRVGRKAQSRHQHAKSPTPLPRYSLIEKGYATSVARRRDLYYQKFLKEEFTASKTMTEKEVVLAEFIKTLLNEINRH